MDGWTNVAGIRPTKLKLSLNPTTKTQTHRIH
jgi:hypothetical protein